MITGRMSQPFQDARQGAAPTVGASYGSNDENPLRKLGFFCAVGLLFLYVSMMHVLLATMIGGGVKLLFVVGILAMIGMVCGGGIGRTFRGRPAYYWAAFFLWLMLALPFSTWKGGSANWLWGYFRAHFVMLFAVGGLVVTWRECRTMMFTVAIGALTSFVPIRMLAKDFGGRGGFAAGTVGNPNDLATHLLLVVPFMLWLVLTSKSVVLRLAACGGVAYGIFLILSSGSRGGAVGFGLAILFYLFRATARQRGVAIIVVPVLVAALLAAVPQRSLNRIASLVSDSGNPEDTEASSVSRMYLLKTGIQAAIDHPIFGVGQGMFAIYEGQHGTVVGGYRGQYQETHNSYVTVAAECGIPAFIFYMGGIFSTFRLLNAAHRQARRRTDCHDIRVTTFCIMLGMVGFCTAMFFVNFTYFYYLPALAGLTIAVSHASQAEFRFRSVVSAGPQTVHP